MGEMPFKTHHAWIVAMPVVVAVYLLRFAEISPTLYISPLVKSAEAPKTLDTDEYNRRMLALAHYVAPPIATTTATNSTSSPQASIPPLLPLATATTSVRLPGQLWPHPTVYPLPGAILPFKRIVAYYGNFYSKQMGVLGEYEPEVVLAKLASTSAMWAAADPSTPTIPAIHYIAVVAQGTAGRSGLWRLRMPDDQIDKALEMARQINGLVFLDVQVGKSTLQEELPELTKYLSMPQVHLGVDPEFSMKTGHAPGTVIGTFDAADINYAANFLAGLVREHDLPPKILVVHRFTQDMVTNYKKITPLPEVQIVMDMDGWGSQAKKKGTYRYVVAPEPVQFTGLKLFYKADLRPPSVGMLSIEEVLSLMPAPIYIQYQ